MLGIGRKVVDVTPSMVGIRLSINYRGACIREWGVGSRGWVPPQGGRPVAQTVQVPRRASFGSVLTQVKLRVAMFSRRPQLRPIAFKLRSVALRPGTVQIFHIRSSVWMGMRVCIVAFIELSPYAKGPDIVS